MTMATYFHGIVTCGRGATATIHLTIEERAALLAGRLPCPCCGALCEPRFTMQAADSASASMSWNGASWNAE